MRNTGRFYSLMVAIALLFTAIVWVFLWGYGMYFEKPDQLPASRILSGMSVSPRDSSASVSAVAPQSNDIILNNTALVADSIGILLKKKLEELDTLRSEIYSYLERENQSSDTTHRDADTLQILHSRIDSLDAVNKLMEEENRLLREKVDQLSKKPAADTAKIREPDQPKIGIPISKPLIVLSNLNLFGITSNHTISNEAKQITKLHLTFFVRSEKKSASELYFSLRTPGGQLLKDARLADRAKNPAGSKTNFTGKINFSSKKEWVTFNLPVSGLKKGSYDLRVYHNGKLLAHQRKTLK